MGGPLVRVGLAPQLLDFLEGQPGLLPGVAAGVAASAQAESLQQVRPEFLDRPQVPWQAVVGRLATLDGLDKLFYLALANRGALPPVLR